MLTFNKFKKHKARGLISPTQEKLMLHAIGFDHATSARIYSRGGTRYYKPYRNYYDAGAAHPLWENLKEKGLAEGDKTYSVTTYGLAVLSNLIETYIYSENSDCTADAKADVMTILIADDCYCGYGCWLPTPAQDIARRARLPLRLTRETLHMLEAENLAHRGSYGDCDDEGYPRCYHGYYLTAHGGEEYKEQRAKAWAEECARIEAIGRDHDAE